MSALNQAETKALLEVQGALEHIERGEVPADKLAEVARVARDKVKTVVTMKGHYG